MDSHSAASNCTKGRHNILGSEMGVEKEREQKDGGAFTFRSKAKRPFVEPLLLREPTESEDASCASFRALARDFLEGSVILAPSSAVLSRSRVCMMSLQ